MIKSVKVSVVQTRPVLNRTEKNIRDSLSIMGSRKADLYVLPELAMSGYNFESRRQAARLAEPVRSGPTFHAMAKFSQKHRAYVAYGLNEKSGNRLYNSAALVGPNGFIGLYRKTHLFAREKLFFQPGNTGFRVFSLPFGRVGLMICFDWLFPEAMRTLALKGAQLILHPSNLVLPHCPDSMVTRCLENRVYAATANRVGTEKAGGKALTYIGRSQIVSPHGKILFRLSPAAQGLGAAACDLKDARDKRINRLTDLFRDRRPTFYVR